MTRERVADGLEILSLQLANGETSIPPGWLPEEWATLKGIAIHAIWTTRARVSDPETPAFRAGDAAGDPTTWLDEQPFYELMQQYRMAPAAHQEVVVAAFEAVIAYVREQVALSSRSSAPTLNCNVCGTPIRHELVCESCLPQRGFVVASRVSASMEAAYSPLASAEDRYYALRDAVTMWAGDGVISDDAAISIATEHATLAQRCVCAASRVSAPTEAPDHYRLIEALNRIAANMVLDAEKVRQAAAALSSPAPAPHGEKS